MLEPFGEHLRRFLAVPFVCRTHVPTSKMVHPLIGVVVCEIHRISAFQFPDEPVEAIHSIRAGFDGPFGIPLRFGWLFPVCQQPLEAVFAFGAIIQ